MGASEVEQDGHGIVMATLPATVSQAVDTVAFNAHLDTSPETSGANVRPQVIRKYGGGDIALAGDTTKVIRVATNPELLRLIGKTIITTDGTTLLGSDDKSGVAVIMEAANYLLEHPELPRGQVRVCFTCDEEIGHGVDHVDLAKLGAKVCYTLDGSATGEIDTKTFSADMAKVTVRGVNIHPSIAKGRMVNAVRVAADFVNRLPRSERSPETTDEREGFLHPYVVDGGVAEVRLKVLLRDFETAMLAEHADVLRNAAAESEREFPGSKIEIEIVEQYRNMREGLARSRVPWNMRSVRLRISGGRANGRLFAAGPMARGSPNWVCQRRTFRRASTTRTRRWNGRVWRRWWRRRSWWSSWYRCGRGEESSE